MLETKLSERLPGGLEDDPEKFQDPVPAPISRVTLGSYNLNMPSLNVNTVN